MKKLIPLLLAAALLLCLTACGSSEPDLNTGLYEAVYAELWGIAVDVDEIFEDGFSLELKDGGKAVFRYEGEDYSLKWTLSGEVFHAKGGGAELDGTLSVGILHLENVLDSGVSLTLIDKSRVDMADLGQPQAEEEPAEPVLDAWRSFSGLDKARVADMSAWEAFHLCEIRDHVYYGRFFQKGMNSASVFRMELTLDGTDVKVSGWSTLDDDYTPDFVYLDEAGETVFYRMKDRTVDEAPVGIGRVGTDGSDRRQVYEGVCDYLQLYDGRLYFTDENDRFRCCDPDGGDLQLLIDRAVFYPYMIDGNWILFQDDADNESLHLYSLVDEIDLKLNDERSYSPILNGTELFYMIPADGEAENAHQLSRIDLSRWEEVYDQALGCHVPVFEAEHSEELCGGYYFIRNDWIYPANGFEVRDVKDWRELRDDAYQRLERMLRYYSDDYEINDLFDDRELVKGIEFFDLTTIYGNTVPWLR